MSTYFGYFFSGPEQLVSLGAVLTLWVLLAALGSALAQSQRIPEVNAYLGWALVSFVLTVSGVLTPLPFSWTAGALCVLSVGAFTVQYRAREAVLPEGYWKLFILAIPFLLIISGMMPSQWDEFSHWLPAPRFLLQTDFFPGTDNPIVGTQMLPAYPYAWVFLNYLSGRIAGALVDNSGGILNMLLLFSFGFTAMRLALQGAGKEMPSKLTWSLAGLALMGGTALNPTFVEKVALTAYADVSTAVGMGFGAVLAWRLLNALADDDHSEVKVTAWQLGLVLSVLVNIKQTNLVLFAVLVFAMGVVALRDNRIALMSAIKQIPRVIGPALLVYLVWRYHVTTGMEGFGGAEAKFLPFESWNTRHFFQIISQMFIIATNKGVYFGIMAIATVFAVRGLWRVNGPFDRLAILVGTAFIGFEAFMLFTYIAHFPEKVALAAVSFWRYNMHLGLLSVVFAAYGVGLLWKRYADGERPLPIWIKGFPILVLGVIAVLVTHKFVSKDLALKLLAAVVVMIGAYGLSRVQALQISRQGFMKTINVLPVVLMLSAPLAFASMIRFDYEAPKPHATMVAKDLNISFPKGKEIVIFDPLGTGEAAVIGRYYMDRYTIPFMSAFQGPTTATLDDFLVRNEGADVLVYSVTPDVIAVLGVTLENGTSYLLSKTDGVWNIDRTWDQPKP